MPSVPLNDTRRLPVDHAAELEAVRSVLQSGLLIHGPQHAAFEQEFAAWVGTTQAIGVASGTDAIELALRAFNVIHFRTKNRRQRRISLRIPNSLWHRVKYVNAVHSVLNVSIG